MKKQINLHQLIMKKRKILFYTSFLTLLSIGSSLYYNLYVCMLFSVIVQITSVNYWRNPVKGIRRNIDILAVSVACIYNLYNSFYYKYYNFTYYVYLGINSYFMSAYFKKYNYVRLAELFHFFVHLLPNISASLMHYHIYSQMNYVK